jgi:gliding motility-associated-like protein
VTVNNATTPTFTQVAPICSGGTFTLPTTSNESINGTWAPAINNTATTTYTFTPTAGQCANTQTMTVTVNNATTPTFTQVAPICSGGTFTLPTTSNESINGTWSPAINNTATTVYTFTPTAGQCANTAIQVVTVNNVITPTFNPIAPICLGGTFNLQNTSNEGINGTWSPAANNTATTTYTFTPASGQCGTSTTMNVVVNPLPIVSAGADQTICGTSPAILTATGASIYTWDNGLGNGATQTVSPTTTTTYTVTGVDANGCINSDQVTVTFLSNTTATFTVDTTVNCNPATFHFTNTTSGGVSYLWNFGDGTTSTNPNPSHTYDHDTCYTISLQVIGNNGCIFSSTIADYVCVNPSPTASFTASTYEISSLYNEVYFTNQSTGATSYDWYFGDETGHSTKTNPKYTYNSDIIRNYIVTLVAKNDYGCTDTAKIVIKMKEETIFYVPNSFTPDGDQFNNVFKPIFAEGVDGHNYELLIFNRWGEIVFESHDPKIGWDGTYKLTGKICQDGVYTWKISIKKIGIDDRITKTGSLTLIR